MTARPKLLDLYCCAGGAAMGYHRAGFDVIGVDIVDRPNYPFTFWKGDALRVLDLLIEAGGRVNETPGRGSFRFTAVHASCPCQEGNPLSLDGHPQLVPPTRERLEALGLPYVIEQPTTNRPGLIRRDLTLCMDMFYTADFPPPWVQRHRSFELSGFTVPEMQHALGIDWTDMREELTEAIPPAYTEYIGQALIDHLDEAADEREDRRTGGTFARHYLGSRPSHATDSVNQPSTVEAMA